MLSERVLSWLAALDEGRPLAEIWEQLPEYFGYEGIRVFEIHEGAGEVVYSAGKPIVSQVLISSLRVFEQGVLGQAIREGKILEVPDYESHPLALEKRRGELKSILVVPLRNSGSTLGAIVMINGKNAHPKLSAFQEQEVRVLQSVLSSQLAVRKVQRRIQRQQGLLAFTSKIHDLKSLEQLVPMLFRSMSEYLDYSAITLTLLEGSAIRIYYAIGEKGRPPEYYGVTIEDPDSGPLTKQILETSEPILIGDTKDPVIRSYYKINYFDTDTEDGLEMRSYIGTLINYGELKGVLSVQSEDAWKYGLTEMEYLNSLAQVLSFGLERVRWYALDGAARSLSRLGWTDDDLGNFPMQVLRVLEDLWKFEIGAVYLRRGDSEVYEKAAATEKGDLPEVVELPSHPAGEPRLYRIPEEIPDKYKCMWSSKCRGGLMIPIPNGFVWLANKLGFTDWDVRMARSLAREIYLPFDRLRQHVKLRDEAALDPLTGVFNRRKLEENLSRLISLANRYGDTFTVVVVDMFNFGRVNNLHGHLVGDRVLARVARVLKENMREGDDVYRMGGDEFVIVLRRSGKKDAVKAALRCAEALSRDEMLSRHGVSANFGLAEYEEGATPESLLEMADREMYAAKARRVSVIEAIQEE